MFPIFQMKMLRLRFSTGFGKSEKVGKPEKEGGVLYLFSLLCRGWCLA